MIYLSAYYHSHKKITKDLVFARVVHVTKLILSPATNDLPTQKKSSVIYKYKHHCDSQYLGHIKQLQEHIKQHAPKQVIEYHTSS